MFTTVWLPGGSFKAVRLGWLRIQRCPGGDHLAVVMPVREADLTYEERRIAAQYRDTRVPWPAQPPDRPGGPSQGDHAHPGRRGSVGHMEIPIRPGPMIEGE